MTQYNTLNVTLSDSKLKKIKSGIKHGTEVTLKLLSNAVGSFLHKLLITNAKFSSFHKAFTNNASANINYQKLNYIK